MRRLPWMVVLACLAAALLIAPAHAAPGPPATPQLIDRAAAEGRIDRDTGTLYLAYALLRPSKLPRAYRSDTPWDGTLPLLRLRDAVPRMRPGPRREEAEGLVSVTSTSNCGGESANLPSATSSTHFYVEHGTVGGGLSVADYVTSLEQSWSTEVDSFGWAAPPVAPTPAPGSRYHVRIDDLGSGLYGFVSSSGTHAGLVGNNPNTSWNDGDAYASCMVLNDDYGGFPSGAQDSLDATTAHEFNHSLQFGYGALHGSNVPDDVFVEGGATWVEDEVFDSANDNYFFLWPVFGDSLGDYDNSPYDYWIAFRGFTERYGSGVAGGGEQVMQDFWEETSKNTGDNLTAMQTALANRGTTLADAFHAYAVAVRFRKACGGGYAYPYCLEEGPAYPVTSALDPHHTISTVGGSTPTNGAGRARLEDNYALNWVALPTTGGPYSVTLDNLDAAGQFRATVACDTGSAISLSALPAVVGAGGTTTLNDYDPSGCLGAPIAVVTNQSQTEANPGTSTIRDYRVRTSTPPVPQHALSVSVSGSGTVTSSPAGISCEPDCSQPYDEGTVVTLTPTADAGWSFGGWGGDCSGSGACQVTMSQVRSVSATFTENPPPVQHTLEVTVTGNGTVTSDPAGISCGLDCTQDYDEGTVVTLTPTADAGWSFGSWGGACSGSGACQVTMSQARDVSATFTENPPPVQHTLEVLVTGSGSVSSSPAGISCGLDCTQDYDENTPVTLTPTADAGWSFSGWGGDCSGSGACAVTMDAARNVTATFTEDPPPPPPPPSGDSPPPATSSDTTTTPSPAPITTPLAPTTLVTDTVRPRVSGVRLTPSRFLPVVPRRRARAAAGTTVRYLLSEPARVVFRVERRLIGRRVGRRCVRTTRANRRRARCVRWPRLRGAFSQNGRAGANARRFTGRLAGRALRPGRYRVVAISRDAAGNRGVLRRAYFVVLAPRSRR